ncbi:MAG: hypothetical protein AAGF06_02490 [Pseudomonadota bacterium]
MNKRLSYLSDIVAKANDAFAARSMRDDTMMGIMEGVLRKQGINADALTLDCPARDKKMVFLLHDDQPDQVTVALGNKAGDIHSSSDHPTSELTQAVLVDMMNDYFTG